MSASGSRATTAARSHGHVNQLALTHELCKMPTRSSLAALSHHSFFSRHNPHPNRVRHIQGLNGRPVCSVRDDWFVSSALFPHPLLKSHVLRKEPSQHKSKSALFSEAWRDELKELAARVSLSSQAQMDRKEPEDEPARRKTQYSAETGRIVPPSSRGLQRRSPSQRLAYHQPFHDQELMVLEILCQILQTDSLSAVQQWLLLAGQREKDLVMGMIRQALDGVDLSGHRQRSFLLPAGSPRMCGRPPFDQPWRRPRRASSHRPERPSDDDKPERIGDAEVLEIHTEDRSHP